MPSKLSLAIGQARGILPLPRLAQTIGLASATLERKAECPFCKDATGKFSIWRSAASGRWFFKCHRTKPEVCLGNVNDHGYNEIAFLQLLKGWDEDTAIREYIVLAEEAGHVKLYDFEAIDARKGSGEAEEERTLPDTPPLNAWDALHRKLVLNADDARGLGTKRGFDSRTIKLLGFSTNNRANGQYIDALGDAWPAEKLLGLGILQRRGARTMPNDQLLGKGLTGRKDDEGEAIWDWTQPILIPYLGEDGRAFYLRPHKGGVKQERDDFDEEFTSSHVYAPFLLSELATVSDGTIIVTEAEFKAAAAFQARVPCVGIPGITFGRHKGFRKELVGLLHRNNATRVVIVFDNEVKDDPQFEDKFKADPYDREDTNMWALYLARDLREEFEHVTIGKLPDEWRIHGKADIDSALAGFVHSVPGHAHFNLKNGFQEGTLLLRRGLLRVIEDSLKPDAYLKSFPPARRNVIHNKFERLWNPPELKHGGDLEEKMARRFMQQNHEGNPIDAELSRAFRKIHGGYYKRRAPNKEAAKLLSIEIDSLERKIAIFGAIPKQEESAETTQAEPPTLTVEQRKELGITGPTLAELRDELAAKYERMKGMPEDVSDAILRCDYKKFDTEGNAVRLVRIKNKRNGKWSDRLYRLPALNSASPQKFREWASNTGLMAWSGGQDHLDTLMQDLDNSVEGRNIYEINYFGYHKPSDLWFFADCAFAPNGAILKADDSNIIWHEGKGHQVDASVDERGTSFEQGAPLMLASHDALEETKLEVDQILQNMTEHFYNVVGDYDAWIFIGTLASYAIAPELLKYYGGHPGAWVYGQRGGGKTTLVRWGMRMWGYKHLDGIAIDDRTTEVGMNRDLAQYSCQPVWFEEYRHETITPRKVAILRGAFDRNSGSKGRADSTNRTISAKVYTTPIVSGESSSSDGATRSRYTQFNIAKSRRLPGADDSFHTIQSECRHYYKIGHYIMANRTEFWTRCQAKIKEWWEDKPEVKLRIADERVRYVYAVARAAFLSLAEMLEIRHEDYDQFDDACLRFGETSLHDVMDETFTNSFWNDVVSGIRAREIDLDFFEQAVVQINPDGSLTKAAGAVSGPQWIEVLFLAAKPVYDQYAVYMRKQNRNPPNDYSGMRRDIARETYWLPPPQNSSRAHSARIKGATTKVWALIVEEDDPRRFQHAEEILDLIKARRKHSESSGVNGVA